MAVDSWMPIGYRFPDNVEIRQALFDGGDWQIYKSLNDLFILVVKERMFERWSKSNLVKGYNSDKVRIIENAVTSSVLSPILSLQTFPTASSAFRENDMHYVDISFNNISETVSLEKTLEANSNFLTNLTEQVPGGLYQMVLDQEGKMSFAFLSKGIGSVLGLSSKELESFFI